MAKKIEKKPAQPEPEPYVPVEDPRTKFIEHYASLGYHVHNASGVLMFEGNLKEFGNIAEMLKKDGYIGSFGMSEKRTATI